MPSINLAMEGSLGRRGNLLDLVAASLGTVVQGRDAVNQAQDVATTFSSWGNCMKATYCK